MEGLESSQSSDDGARAVADDGTLKLSVRFDGEWCPEVRWDKPDLPVFIAEDGSEVGIRDDRSIRFETPAGRVEEIDEPDIEKEAKELYKPSIHSADIIEVRDINRRPVRSEAADFGGGESTGVQEL